MAGGRPTEYNDDTIQLAMEYIKICKDEEKEFHATRGAKSDSFQRLIKVRIPTIEGLASHLNISRETVYAWEKEKPEFSDVIEQLRTKQADSLINNGLSGDYNPTIAKVLLTKHGYREGIDTDLTSKGDKINILDPKSAEISKKYEEELKKNI